MMYYDSDGLKVVGQHEETSCLTQATSGVICAAGDRFRHLGLKTRPYTQRYHNHKRRESN
jgi:hypothetical protein